MQQQGTNLLPDESPAWLACQSMRYAVTSEPVGQHVCLSGFAAPFNAFEHNEESGHQRLGLGLGLGLGRMDSVIDALWSLLCMKSETRLYCHAFIHFHTLLRSPKPWPSPFPQLSPLLVVGHVVLESEVRDLLFSSQVAKCVLQLHLLNEQVMLGVEPGGHHGTLEVERKPFLNSAHPGSLSEVQKQREVEHDRRGQDGVTAAEVALDLHRVAEPTKDAGADPA